MVDAMTINLSQGKTFNTVGIYLSYIFWFSVFSDFNSKMVLKTYV